MNVFSREVSMSKLCLHLIACLVVAGFAAATGFRAEAAPTPPTGQSTLLNGWAPPPTPTSPAKQFASAALQQSMGGLAVGMGVTPNYLINPDSSGTGIVYSTYADDPNSDAALVNLAENLGNDPIKIYEWVRNNVRTEFYYGGTRGAYQTFLDRAGNDIDQCALLGALFRASGYTPTYRWEYMWLPRSATGANRVGVYEWLGVDNDASALDVLANCLGSVDGSSTFKVAYMWVAITIPGRGEVRFVPSLKPHTVGRKPALDSLSGYSWANATAAAGATTTGSYSPAINSAGLRSYLGTLAIQSSDAMHSSASLHDLSGAELSSLWVIQPELTSVTAPNATNYPEGLTFTDNASATAMSGIPVSFLGHIKLRVGNFTHWFEGAELMAKSLVCEFDASGTATIRFGGDNIGQEASGNSSNNVEIELGYEYPIAYLSGQSYISGGTASIARQSLAVIPYGFGRMVSRFQKTLLDISEKEAASPANVTLTDRLLVIGQQYMSQCHELSTLAAAQLGYEFRRTCHMGLIYLNNGNPIVNIQVNPGDYRARSASARPKASVISAVNLLLGVLEGTAIEQMSGQRSFGTPSLIDYGMTLGRGAYLLDGSNYSSTVGSLQNYNDATLGTGAVSWIQNLITAGDKVVLLTDSNITLSGNSFGGFYDIVPFGGVASYIKGAMGGVTTGPTGTNSVAAGVNAAQTTATKTTPGQTQSTSTDPVDLTNGAFLKNDTDLVVGVDGEPNGLTLARSYNSARRLSDPVGLGRGWTHSYGLSVSTRSPNDIDSLRAEVDEVLPVLIAARLVQDAVSTESSARAWLMASTALSWAVERQINSRAAITMGARSMEFIQRTDGSYTSPSDITATLAKQGDGSFDLAFRHGNTVHFRSSDGKFTSITDQFGNSLIAAYDGSNRLYTVTDAYSRTLTFSYDGTGRLNRVDDSTGRNVQYGRTGSGNFTFTDAEGKTQTLEMNSDYLLTRVVDARGRTVVENDYDFWKRVWQQRTFGDTARQTKIWIAPGVGAEVDPLSYKSWTYFDARGRRIFSVDPLSQVTAWQYDGVDHLVKAVTPRGATTSYAYDPNHVLISETNPAGDTRTIVPDGQSRPWKVRNFEGKETVITYTAQHKVDTVTAPGGIVSSFTYDARGRVLTEHPAAFASGTSLTFAYDSYGNIDTITHPGAAPNVDSYTFNARGDLTEIVDRGTVGQNGAKTTYDYNNRRQRTSTTLWRGTTQLTTQTFYDDAGDVDYTLDASGRKVDQDYDALGHQLTVKRGPVGSQVTTLTNTYEDHRLLLWKSTDALSHATTFSYDAAQRLTDTYDPLNRRVQQAYDADGNPTTTTTPLASATTTTYRLNGWKDAITDAEAHTRDYLYDKDGRPTTLANRLNKSFTWIYDDDNRTITSKTPLLKATVGVGNTRGLPASIAKPSDSPASPSINFTSYDGEGRLLTRTDGVGTTTYTYWPNGLPKEVTENGHTTYRGYDELNRLNEYRDGEGNTITYEYLSSGELWKLHYPGGRIVTYDYDDFGRLWHVTDWASRQTTYSYDNASRLTRIDRPNGTYRTQDYDAAGQLKLIQEFKSDGSRILYLSAGFDDDGRISSLFLNPKPASFTLPQDSLLYDDDNRLSTWNGQNITFDADGNMTSGPLPSGTFGTHVYDARNRLTSAGGSGYRYNPDGQRVEITGTGAATFAIDPNAAMSRTLMRTKGGTTTYYVYGLGLLYEDTAGATKTYHFNQVGSTLAITDGGQNVTDRVGYSPFGTIVERTNPAGTPTDTAFLFNGELGVMTDANGLLYMRARYYNLRLMRFCNADPIGFGGGMNWYAFSGNNPLSLVDPLGLQDSSHPNNDAVGSPVVLSAFYVVEHVKKGDTFPLNLADNNKGIINIVGYGVGEKFGVSGATLNVDFVAAAAADYSWLQIIVKETFTNIKVPAIDVLPDNSTKWYENNFKGGTLWRQGDGILNFRDNGILRFQDQTVFSTTRYPTGVEMFQLQLVYRQTNTVVFQINWGYSRDAAGNLIKY